MLVAFLLLCIALTPGCVRTTVPDGPQIADLTATDRVPETPLLPAETVTPPETALNTPTVRAEPAAESTGKPALPARPSRTLPIANYTVGSGETLWSIAARPNIYADALLWPLLYQANRDQIRDPRQIYPGQKLSIPRNLSEAQKEEAREAARRSNIFPVNLPPTQPN